MQNLMLKQLTVYWTAFLSDHSNMIFIINNINDTVYANYYHPHGYNKGTLSIDGPVTNFKISLYIEHIVITCVVFLLEVDQKRLSMLRS